ncbi:uncharacterized protein TNCV_2454921 [Trichonephila clavipes]|nr:uncharacterized protein TNCV_2454921 [Trichonephila clavipes]
MRLRALWPRLAFARYQSRQHPSPFWRFSLELNTRIRPLGLPRPPEHHWYQCSRPGGSLAHGFTRQDKTLLARFREREREKWPYQNNEIFRKMQEL